VAKSFLNAALAVMCSASTALAQDVEKADPYGQPSVAYLTQFVTQEGKSFVYERYDAKGALTQRDVKAMTTAVTVGSATERSINGQGYRLRGLRACPELKVTYQAEEWDCQKAAADYAGAVYGRASVVLCKTLVLKSVAGKQDPVSCFALLGAGNAVEPYKVYNDDDSMVFLGLADIGKTDAGQSLRPDLSHSKTLGESFQ